MNKDLNIRAAKALGCEIINGEGIANLPDSFQPLLSWPEKVKLLHYNMLKFTTSYDWAMSGVKDLRGEDLGMFINNLATIRGVKGSLAERDTYSLLEVMDSLWLATPEQITQAWVEVLEAA